MTILNTVAEDTNTFTCRSWTCPYFRCFFRACCTYEESVVICWLSLDQPSGSLPGKRPALNTVAGTRFPVVTWRKPLKPVNEMWAVWSPCSYNHWIFHPEVSSSAWKWFTSLNWFESVLTLELSLLGTRRSHGKLWEAYLLCHSRTITWKVLSALIKWFKFLLPPTLNLEQ